MRVTINRFYVLLVKNFVRMFLKLLLVLSTFCCIPSASKLRQSCYNKINIKVSSFRLQSSTNIENNNNNNNRIIKKILFSPITLFTSSLKLATDTVYTVSDIVVKTPTATTQVNTNINTFINNVQNIKLPEIKNKPKINLTETEILMIKSKQQIELKNKYKKFLPQTYITKLLLNIRSLIDRYYEYQDLQEQKKSSNININTNNKQPKLIQSLSYSTDATKSKKGGILDKYEEIKESYYSSTDTLSNLLTAITKTKDSTIQTLSNTANTIANLPQRTTQTVEVTKSNIQDTITQTQQNIQTLNENLAITGQIIYKIITLESAKETYTRIQTNIQSLQTKYTRLTSPPPSPPPPVVPVTTTTKISAKSAQKPDNPVDKVKSVYGTASRVASVMFGATSSLVSGVSKVVSWALSKRSDRRPSSSSSTQQLATTTADTRMSVVLNKQDSAPIYTTATTAATAGVAPVSQDSIAVTTQAVNKAEVEVESAEVPAAPTFLWDTLTAAATVADTGSDANKTEEKVGTVMSSDSSTTIAAEGNEDSKAVKVDD